MSEKSNKPKATDPLADLFSNVQLTGLSKPKNKGSRLQPLNIDLPVESTKRNPPVLDEPQTGLKQPKRPPRYMGEEYESYASDIEIEELDSEDEENEEAEEVKVEDVSVPDLENPPSSNAVSDTSKVDENLLPSRPEPSQKSPTLEKPAIDVNTQIQIAMLKQKMQRQRLAIKKKQEATKKESSSQVVPSATNVHSEPSPPAPSNLPQVEDSLAKLNTKITQQKATPSAMELFLAAAAESEQQKDELRRPKAPEIKPKPQKEPAVTPEAITQPIAKPLMGNRLMLRIEDMIRTQLPLLKEFHVASALDSFDRPLMRAIWRSHRTKFLMSGQLEYAVAALSVIDAFEHIEEGQLVAAYVETTASDYLIWVDLPHQRLVAAFADAKSYFANK